MAIARDPLSPNRVYPDPAARRSLRVGANDGVGEPDRKGASEAKTEQGDDPAVEGRVTSAPLGRARGRRTVMGVSEGGAALPAVVAADVWTIYSSRFLLQASDIAV